MNLLIYSTKEGNTKPRKKRNEVIKMKVNFLVRTIELTAEEMRQASKPNSREYTELLQIRV